MIARSTIVARKKKRAREPGERSDNSERKGKNGGADRWNWRRELVRGGLSRVESSEFGRRKIEERSKGEKNKRGGS